jgi:oxygen-independent coproporphyrinogen-3 oxidase
MVETGALHTLTGAARSDETVAGLPQELAGSGPRSDTLGLYIHVPFCAQRCHYCSFNTAPLDDAMLARYLKSLGRELDLLAALPWARRVRLATVFLGGGTPSLLAPEDLAALLDRVRSGFDLAADAEVTIECNPESVTRAKLAAYRQAGVNRVSLGVQSLDDAVLPRLGRLHDARGARRAFEAAREAGVTNLSVDLMYGLPALDVAGWGAAVEAVLGWAPEHLSAYGLTLDNGSLWGATGVAGLPPEETVVAQYWALAHTAAARGFEHYEISNYARPGFRARHNQIYWRAAEYLAAGPGACGHVGGVRYANAKATPRYCEMLEADALPVDFHEVLTPGQQLAERLILGLRTADGVPTTWLDRRVAGDEPLRRRVETWRREGLLILADGRARLTEAGFLLSDALFVELL